MAPPNNNAISVVWWREKGELMVYVIDALTINPLFFHQEQVKLPGGGAEGKESPIETAIRELKEETGLVVKRKQKAHLILEARIGVHNKYAFLISRYACKGRLRKGKLWDHDSILSKPRPVSLNEAIDVVLCSKNNTFNRAALVVARNWINEHYPAA